MPLFGYLFIIRYYPNIAYFLLSKGVNFALFSSKKWSFNFKNHPIKPSGVSYFIFFYFVINSN